jgi:hypothetical protein
MSSLVLVDDAGEVSQGFSQMRKVPMMGDVSFARPRSMCEALGSPQDLGASYRVSYDPHYSFNSVSLRPTQISAPASRKPSQGIGSIARIIARFLLAAPDQDRFQIFAGFAWDRFGDDLLALDLKSLTVAQLDILQTLEDLLTAAAKGQGHAVLENGQATIFALGLIAQSQGGRLASRFARRALKDAPDWVKLPV